MEKTLKGLYFLPIGGADDIGMNMYAYSCNGKWIVVDAGYGFLNDDYPGMDMCYASPAFLRNFKQDIEALFITHAHEDHMGAIAHIWPDLGCPVYATPFATGLMKARLTEYKMADIVPLNVVHPLQTIKTENFEVTFVPMVHSVPETCGLFIKTPYGNVFHATDWRFDGGDLNMLQADEKNFEEIGKQGVDLFVCDSTNILVKDKQPNEMEIRENLIKLVPQIKGGLIATCFASNLMRLESFVLAAIKAGRTPVLVGKSLITNMKIARDCGYFANLPETHTIEEVQGITEDKALYICTGSQANYRSALSLIAKGESKYIKLIKGDTVIFSSKIIPGNEDKIEHMQEQMIDKGVNVITDEIAPVHTSGHASQEELEKMYHFLKPKIVFPVHGDKRFIRQHKRFALSCGVEQVCSGQNGDIFLFRDGKIEKVEEAPTDVIGVDRGRSVSLSSPLIANRKRIAYNCSVFISMVVSKENTLKDLQISSIDILEEADWLTLADEIKTKLTPVIEQMLTERGITQNVQDAIRSKIRKEILNATDIKPVTFFHLYQEKGEEK